MNRMYSNPPFLDEHYGWPEPKLVKSEKLGILHRLKDLIAESGIYDDSDAFSDFDLEEHLKQMATDDGDIIEVPVIKTPAIVIELSDASDDGIVTSDDNSDSKPSKEKRKAVVSVMSTPQNSVQNSGGAGALAPDNASHSKSHQITDESRKKKSKKYSVDYRSKEKNSYSSSDSEHSSDARDRGKHKRVFKRSRYFSSDEEKRKVGKEYEEEEFYYRSLFCDVCNLQLNSEGSYYSHMHGKRHQKAVKQTDVAKAVAETINHTAQCASNRYPQPAENVYRKKVNEIAKSQRVIEDTIKAPCPGLEKIIEIQGLQETKYYCEFCDSPCSISSILPHLMGYKHQLGCLKYFKPDVYERYKYKYKRKQDIEGRIIDVLRDIEKKNGRGQLTVEMEFSTDPKSSNYKSNNSKGKQLRPEEIPGPSSSKSVPDEPVPDYSKTFVPDMSKNDYYCQLCDSHMNNFMMWESHIRGKRHLKNVKKPPGEAPSKVKARLVPNAKPLLLSLLRGIECPVVGLNYIRETQNPDISGAQYNCFLCGACMTHLDVVDHIISPKHMTKFLEVIKHPSLSLLKGLQMNESGMFSIVLEECAKIEHKEGMGKVDVYVMKK